MDEHLLSEVPGQSHETRILIPAEVTLHVSSNSIHRRNWVNSSSNLNLAASNISTRSSALRKSYSAPSFFTNLKGCCPPLGHHRHKRFRRSTPPIVSQAFVGVALYVSASVVFYYATTSNDFHSHATFGLVDALYFSVVTLCTIGYGDIVPSTTFTKLFTCVFILVGFGFIDILLNGLVTYALDRQEAVLLSSVDVRWGSADVFGSYVVDVKKGRMRVRMKVGLALAVVICCIAVGMVMVRVLEGLSWVDSFYLSVTSVTTVGYGDRTFRTLKGRLFATVWLLVSTLAVARAFLYLAELRIDKRNRRIAKWVLHRKMTLADLVAADLDNDGSIRAIREKGFCFSTSQRTRKKKKGTLFAFGARRNRSSRLYAERSENQQSLMEKEPLLPYSSPRRRLSATSPLLCSLPETEEFTLPLNSPRNLTPPYLKDLIIFGPSDGVDLSEALSVKSPRPLSSPSAAVPVHDDLQWSTKTKSNLHRSKTAPAMSAINEIDLHPLPKPQFGSSSIVRQAVFLLALYLALGVAIYSINRRHFSANETHPVVDALYFCIVTMCTIGYGDITPASPSTKIFSILFVLVGFGFIDILLSGMVSYVLDLQETLLLSAVKGGAQHPYLVDVKKGRMRIRMKVGLALGVVVICIGVGTGVMHFVERLGWLDSFYLSVMSVTTVGYGDKAFRSLPGRVFASIWLLVSTLAVARAFLYLAEARIDKRHRKIAKWVLGRDMTVSEFLAADIDNNGFVSKSEYVIYKLKEMGKIAEKDIQLICQQFDRLDTGNCGRITLSDLMDTRQ